MTSAQHPLLLFLFLLLLLSGALTGENSIKLGTKRRRFGRSCEAPHQKHKHKCTERQTCEARMNTHDGNNNTTVQLFSGKQTRLRMHPQSKRRFTTHMNRKRKTDTEPMGSITYILRGVSRNPAGAETRCLHAANIRTCES